MFTFALHVLCSICIHCTLNCKTNAWIGLCIVRMKPSRVVRGSDCQCQSRNSSGFDPASSYTVELKVNKNENFFGFDFDFCSFSLLVIHK
jgi:hypothetical protein